MPTLSIDLDDLIMALSTLYELDDPSHYLDLQTGGIIYAGEGLEALPADLADNPARYRWIEPTAAEPALHVVQDFIAQLGDEVARSRLIAAFEDNEPFEAFRDAMLALPALRNAWFSFHQRAYTQLAAEWCRQQGIEPRWR